MHPDKAVEETLYGSQNFCLKLSQDSTVSNTYDTNDDKDIIIISDSSSKSECSSPEYSSAAILSKCSSEKDKVHIMESSDSDCTDAENKKYFKTWKLTEKSKFVSSYHERRNALKRNNISYTSDESSSSSSSEDIENIITRSTKTSTTYISDSTGRSNKSTSKIIVETPSSTTTESNLISSYATAKSKESSNSSKISTPLTPSSVPKVNNDFKRNLSHKDAKNIIKNIKSTKIVYESPKAQKHDLPVLYKDTSGNIIHPAVSPKDNWTVLNTVIDETLADSESDTVDEKSQAKPAFDASHEKKDVVALHKGECVHKYQVPEVRKQNNSTYENEAVDNVYPTLVDKPEKVQRNTVIDETIDSQSDVIQSSQANLAIPYKTHVSKFLNAPHVERDMEPAHSELSERKKKQISEWLMANSTDSHNDSSVSIVPPSNGNDISSGNSSLERLEMHYETPNNRNKIRQHGTDKGHKGINQYKTPSTTPRQATINDYIRKTKNNSLELGRSAKKVNVSSNMFVNPTKSPTTNTSHGIDIQDCADILDKLYGKSWRDKADVLFANSEPRKQIKPTKDRAVQTERKPIYQARKKISDSNDDDSDTSITDLNLQNRVPKKSIKKNTKQRDSFINDKSSSESGGESLYLTALTNPRTSINNEKPQPRLSPSVRRVLKICDTDTENEDNENDADKPFNVRRRRLLFSDDDESDGSCTSEYDPGDNVPPKRTTKKERKSKVSKPSKPSSENKKHEGHRSFLESLSNSVPIADAHPDAKKYRLDYKNNKEDLCKFLYKLYNEKVFGKSLPVDMSIEWNVRMRGTAGFCYNKKSLKALGGITKSSRIVLSTKVLDTPDRLRDTLIHEMCHAAAWLINDVCDGHGPFWTEWANKAMKTFPELPAIRRCHDYKIKTKFTYKCIGCGYSIGRHSKSLDIEKKRCGHCYGKFELLINKTTKSGTVQMQTPKREPSAFALYVKENYGSVKKERNAKHAEVMKILGQQFSAIKLAKKQDD